MNSSADTVKIQPLKRNKEKETQRNIRILSSRINFEDPTILLQSRTLLANFIRGNQISQSNPQSNQ
ncbi:unnamed protein product [Paramecium pentaurelia]|uniref:Uncharacterized protein n=1 Tax=Paramecium pentaurelia TaxID=43138 RepID=A0A8S1UQE9_9CILI|nr:unnamed protein product [Paramecium pentaurelia]